MRRVMLLLLTVLTCLALVIVPLPAAAVSLPDLVVTTAWRSGTQVFYTLVNTGAVAAGSANAPANYYVGLYVSGKMVSEDHITVNLSPGQQVTRLFPYQWPYGPGQYAVTVLADTRQQMPESNEQNNLWQGTFVVTQALPDLIVDNIYTGSQNKLAITAKNAGSGPLPAQWLAVASVAMNGKDMGFISLANPTSSTGGGITSPGGTSTYLTAWDITQTVTVRVFVDSTQSIAESNEQNNVMEKQLAPVTQPPVQPPVTPPAIPPEKTDTEPPHITSGPVTTQVTANGATVTWTTNEPCDSLVKYGAQSSVHDKSVASKDLKTSHTLSLSGLYAGQTCVFIAVSHDAAGNAVQSKPIVFTTPGPGDGTKPALTLNIPDIASGRIKVPVDAQDNIAVERVQFFLDGKQEFTDYSVPFEWHVDTTPLAEGVHRVTAIAIDAAGNRTEAARDFAVRNRFPIDESPVHITINRPAQDSTVVGVVEIDASITHTNKARITDAEIRVDGVTVRRVTYPATSSLFESEHTLRDAEKAVRISWNWDTAPWAAGSTAIIEVIAHDSAGNSGHASARVTKGIEGPMFELGRTVTRYGNYFHVVLTVRNTASGSTAQATEVLVKDISRGFMPSANRLPSYDWNLVAGTAEGTAATLGPGGSFTFEYDVVPVLLDPEIDDYRVGTRTVIQYRNWRGVSSTAELSLPYVPGDPTSLPYPLIPSEVAEAISACDYLIVTDPERLFATYPADDVNYLLQMMTNLAMAKSGVLGFRRPGASWVSANNLRANLDPAGQWGARLSLESIMNGYLLIVGEANIVPSFDVAGFNAPFNGGPVDVVHYTDYPYADTCGDERVELRVGRLIGLNTRELARPIEVSLAVNRGRLTFDRSNALLVSGPEGTWENFIAEANELGDVLIGQGMTVEKVHAEYDAEEKSFLRESLVLRGDYSCLGDPGHLDGRFPCTRTHPPTDIVVLRALITRAQAEDVQATRRGVAGTYTTYAVQCDAGNAHGLDTKAGARDKDVIFWGGHGGPGGWGWVLDDFAGGCGAANNMVIDLAANPLRFGMGTPVVFAASCLTGNYMAEPGRSGARAFTRNGAAVYLGSTEVTPCGPQQNFTLAFFRTHWTSSTTTTGEGLAGLRNATILLGDVWWRYMDYEFNHYGDPKFVGR